MKRYHYITPEDFEIAEKNGIPKQRLYERVRNGMDIDTAITRPVQKKTRYTAAERQLMKEKGITHTTVYYRVNVMGMTREEALNMDLMSREEAARLANEVIQQSDRVFTPEQRQTAKRNGISYSTMWSRVKMYGWSVEDAVRVPVMDSEEVLKRAREKSPFQAFNDMTFRRKAN